MNTAILHRLLIRINAHRHDPGRTDAVAAASNSCEDTIVLHTLRSLLSRF